MEKKPLTKHPETRGEILSDCGVCGPRLVFQEDCLGMTC